jgi:hypothetical protein
MARFFGPLIFYARGNWLFYGVSGICDDGVRDGELLKRGPRR